MPSPPRASAPERLESEIPLQHIQKQVSTSRTIELPEEPTTANPDSLELVFRMPQSGERIKRRFLKSDKLGLVYDYIDYLQNEKKCTFMGLEYTSRYQVF